MTEINVPRLRFSGFDEVWEENKIGNLALVTKLAGFEFSKYVSYSDEGNIIALRGLNVKNDSLDLRDVKYIDDSDFSKLKRSKLFIGDILFTYVGTVGNSAIVKENNKFYLAPNVALIRIKDKELSSYFFQKEISTNRYFRKVVYPLAASSSQMALSMESIRKFKFWYCSIDEQERIGSFFAKIDKIIELQTQKLEQLNKLKRGYLQKMFPQDGESEPRLRFSGFSGEWEEKKIGEFAPLESGYSFKSSKFVSNGVPIVRISNILKNGSVGGDFKFYQKNEKISKFMLQKGSILIAMSGVTVGKIALLTSNNFYLNQRVGFFNTCDDYDNYFVFQLLKTNKYVQNMNAIKVAGAQPNISKNEVDKFKFYLPDYNEQKKIGSFLSKIDKMINNQSNKINALQQEKKSYLQKMFI